MKHDLIVANSTIGLIVLFLLCGSSFMVFFYCFCYNSEESWWPTVYSFIATIVLATAFVNSYILLNHYMN